VAQEGQSEAGSRLPEHVVAGIGVWRPRAGSILKDKLQLPPPVITMSAASPTPKATASDSGFNWTDALLGATFETVLIGLGISGMRIDHRRTAQV
jgi:hypothetical protein